ncbi:MAG: hypothetical protein M2R45_05327 [Verrucomicrobia subdivision 3 bacterium]|nr:hypothetical protein [Limisphaerales bacterium]MCS1414955.1 hypothetical protein [Limisphaerales bacterium]
MCSNDQGIVSNSFLEIIGDGSSRMLRVTAPAFEEGKTTVTIAVEEPDGGLKVNMRSTFVSSSFDDPFQVIAANCT